MDGVDLGGKVAIVTGAGRGIGRAVALGWAAAGASVVVVARTGSELDEVVDTVAAAGGEAFAVVADLAVRDGAGPRRGTHHRAFRTARPGDGQCRRRFAGRAARVGSRLRRGPDGEPHERPLARPCGRAPPRRAGREVPGHGVGRRPPAHARRSRLLGVQGRGVHAGAVPGGGVARGPHRGERDHPWAGAHRDQRRDPRRPQPPRRRCGIEWFKQPEDVVPMALFLAGLPDDGPSGQIFSLLGRDL